MRLVSRLPLLCLLLHLSLATQERQGRRKLRERHQQECEEAGWTSWGLWSPCRGASQHRLRFKGKQTRVCRLIRGVDRRSCGAGSPLRELEVDGRQWYTAVNNAETSGAGGASRFATQTDLNDLFRPKSLF